MTPTNGGPRAWGPGGLNARGQIILRAIAVAIAVAGAIDPAWSTMRVPPPQLVAIRMMSGDAAPRIKALQTALPAWQVMVRDVRESRIPCDPAIPCVLIADGLVDGELATDRQAVTAMVDASDPHASGVVIRGVAASGTHQSAAGVVRVDLERRGPVATTLLTVEDGAATVGNTTVTWGNSDRVTVDVPWWPLASGARVLTVEAQAAAGESDLSDNRVDVGVTVAQQRVGVLVMDARPSWSSTFVRRALDSDPRFAVEHRAAVAPGLSAGTAGIRADEQSLDRIPLVVVGGPDALTADEVGLLDRYVRRRGGSVILLPERAPSAPSDRLFGGLWHEKLVPLPDRIGELRASELLTIADPGPTATALARSGESAVIVDLPRGEGRIVVAGAMDAWRYRDQDDEAFDRYWRSLAQQLADRGEALSVAVSDSLASSSARVPFTLRRRSFVPDDEVEAAAVGRCGDGPALPIRLWPSGSIGEFHGVLPVTDAGICTIEATLGGRHAEASVAVADKPRRGVTTTLEALVTSVNRTRGTVVAAGDEQALARTMIASGTPQPAVVRPMRSWWWLLPFAGCLSTEWWLRRRSGLR